jgi:hypothetical protein
MRRKLTTFFNAREKRAKRTRRARHSKGPFDAPVRQVLFVVGLEWQYNIVSTVKNKHMN